MPTKSNRIITLCSSMIIAGTHIVLMIGILLGIISSRCHFLNKKCQVFFNFFIAKRFYIAFTIAAERNLYKNYSGPSLEEEENLSFYVACDPCYISLDSPF